MSNFAAWSPESASFVGGVLSCLLLFAVGGLTVLTLFATGHVAITFAVFCAALIVGLVVIHGVTPANETSSDDEDTLSTYGAMGFCSTFFLGPVGIMVSAFLLFRYITR